MRLFMCTSCGGDSLTHRCDCVSHVRMVRCPGMNCLNLVPVEKKGQPHIALGMVCCSETCHQSVYDLTRYVDGGEPEVPNGRVIRVDEALVINLTTADYRVIERR